MITNAFSTIVGDSQSNPPKPSGFVIKDSGERQVFSTGAQRDIQKGKGRFDLLPCLAMMRVAQHFENGAGKYGVNNWVRGIPMRRYVDSLLRHAFRYVGGETDEDHLAAIIWNAMCLMETQELIKQGKLPKDLDNLFPNSIINNYEKID